MRHKLVTFVSFLQPYRFLDPFFFLIVKTFVFFFPAYWWLSCNLSIEGVRLLIKTQLLDHLGTLSSHFFFSLSPWIVTCWLPKFNSFNAWEEGNQRVQVKLKSKERIDITASPDGQSLLFLLTAPAVSQNLFPETLTCPSLPERPSEHPALPA